MRSRLGRSRLLIGGAIATAIISAMLVAGVVYALVGVDSFDGGAQQLMVYSGSTTAADVVDTAAALGGERDVYLQWVSGGAIYVYVDHPGGGDDILAYTGGNNAIGRVTFAWDGDDNSATVLDNDGLDAVDLTQGGTNDGMLVRINHEDLRAMLTFRVYRDTADSNWSYATLNLPPLNPGTRMDVFLPFSGFTIGGGTGADFSNVGAIEMILDGNIDASVDVSIDFTESSGVREYGDLPSGYGTGVLSAYHTPRGLRLGYNCDAEAIDNASGNSLGDDNNQAAPDDEDGVTPAGLPWVEGAGGGHLSVTVQGCVNAGGCRLYGWVDWDRDSVFEPGTEQVLSVSSPADGTTIYPIDVPAGFSSSMNFYYARFRICRPDGSTCYVPWTVSLAGDDGEVEDYMWYLGPTAVKLASFTARPEGRLIMVGWETVSEIDNVGFNLYRAELLDGQLRKLNNSLIPSKGPGSAIGFSYSFPDRAVRAGRTYHYWLEAVDIYGMTTRFGPVSAKIPIRIAVPPTGP